MNASGECVGAMVRYFGVPTDHVLVIYDDIDLPVGRLRLRKSGSAGTHNGMKIPAGSSGYREFSSAPGGRRSAGARCIHG